MSDINFKGDEVCYANGLHHVVSGFLDDDLLQHCLTFDDFQLNEIRKGDFIPASELDTEQKYNDVVEVFVLFGFHNNSLTGYKGLSSGEYDNLVIRGNGFSNVVINFDCKRQITYHQIIAIGKLKRMMLEREKPAPKTAPDLTPDFTKVSTNKYEREITDRQGNSATVDVYDVIIAYGVTCPATQHAIKKLLCTGDRGHKDTLTDLSEARDAITRAIELN